MERKRRIYGLVQNVIIFLLTCSAVLLVLCAGVVPAGTLSRALSGVALSAERPRGDTGADTVLPLQMVLRYGGDCRAFPRQTTAGAVFEDAGSLLTQALSSASAAAAVEETEYRRALENNGIYYDFYHLLPLSVLTRWIGGDAGPDAEVRALFLSDLEGGYLTLYGAGAGTAFYRWRTTVPREALASVSERHTGSAAEFAFLLTPPYDALDPYTVIDTERPVLPELLTENPLSADAQNALLTKLKFNLQSKDRYSYTEANGTWVIVQGSGTLRFLPDGGVLYSGDITTPSTARLHEESALEEYVDVAWDSVCGLFGADLGDASFCLLSAEMTERSRAHVTFGYHVDGCLVELRGGKAVEMDISAGQLTGFTAYPRRYRLTDKQTPLLPVPQAAAASHERELFCGYFDDGAELLRPGWMRR